MKHFGVPEIKSPAIPVALSSKKSPDEVGSLLSAWDGIFKVQSCNSTLEVAILCYPSLFPQFQPSHTCRRTFVGKGKLPLARQRSGCSP